LLAALVSVTRLRLDRTDGAFSDALNRTTMSAIEASPHRRKHSSRQSLRIDLHQRTNAKLALVCWSVSAALYRLRLRNGISKLPDSAPVIRRNSLS